MFGRVDHCFPKALKVRIFVLVYKLCVTNYHKFSSLIQHRFFSSVYVGQTSGHSKTKSSVQGSHQYGIMVLIGLCSHLEFKVFLQAYQEVERFQSFWRKVPILCGQLGSSSALRDCPNVLAMWPKTTSILILFSMPTGESLTVQQEGVSLNIMLSHNIMFCHLI